MLGTILFTEFALIVACYLCGFSRATEYNVDGAHLGLTLHSVGAQSTAGTSRLLFDYPAAQRDQILDLLFKPQYGASFQHLKVEIGGDTQISSGAEPSPMRTPNAEDDDFDRGYEHWLMTEAKARNPDIALLGLVYAWPGWISPNGTSPFMNVESEQRAAKYVSKWVSGVKTFHNLTIDWVGLWNEREYTTSYAKTLRKTLDEHGHHSTSIVGSDRFWEPIATDYLSDPDIRQAIDALSAHYPHSFDQTKVEVNSLKAHSKYDVNPYSFPGNSVPASSIKVAKAASESKSIFGSAMKDSNSFANARQAHIEYGVNLWSPEDYSCWTDTLGAKLWASMINGRYIGGNITMISAWHMVSAFYSSVAFWNEGMISATQPWSGHYVAAPTIWASAHTTQFTRRGMRYLRQGKGAGELSGGGTFVSFYDTETQDLTIVIESAGHDIGSFSGHNCNGQHVYKPASAPQNATFALINLNLRGKTDKLVLWRSQLGDNSSASMLFEQLPDVSIIDSKVTIVVQPNAIYTLSTVRTATKAGNSPLNIPPSAAFPLPYIDDFEASAPPSVGRFWSDMDGAFQVSKSSTNTSNQVLKQVVPTKSCCNFIQAFEGPLAVSIIGSSVWENIEASISVSLPDAGSFGIFGIRAKFKAGSFFSGGLSKPTGVFMAVDDHGYQLLGSEWWWTGDVSKGLIWPCGAPACIASGTFTAASTWRRFMITAVNRALLYRVDDAEVQSVILPDDVATGGGFVVIGSSFSEVEFDNFVVRQALEDVPASRCASQPLAGQQLVSVGCGEPAAEAGSRWQLHSNANGTGTISLRSDQSLCIASATPSIVGFEAEPSFHNSIDKGHAIAPIVVLARCDEADSSQQWHYNASSGWISQANGQGALAMVGAAGDFAAVTYGAPGIMWWSPDLGYIHGSSNLPMNCNCIAVCGGPIHKVTKTDLVDIIF